MKELSVKEIAEILDATFLVNIKDIDLHIQSTCATDLMSVVLYYHTPNALLITGLTQPHVIRTAEIAGIRMIAFVQNRRPDAQTIEMARQKGIPLLTTPLCMFNASGKLYESGLQGCAKK